MAVEDFLEPEVVVAVVVTSAIASPKVRAVLRRGAVHGLAGVLMAGDAVSSVARGMRRGAGQAAATAADAVDTNSAAGVDGAAGMNSVEPAPAAEVAHEAVPPAAVSETPETAHKRSRKATEDGADAHCFQDHCFQDHCFQDHCFQDHCCCRS